MPAPTRPRPRTGPGRRGVTVVLGLLLTLWLPACSDSAPASDAPSALTQEQSEVLATVRFRNFDAGLRSVAITIPAEGGDAGGSVDGWYDFAGHIGYADVVQAGTPLGVVLWDGERIAVNETVTESATRPVPGRGWRSDQLDPNSSRMTQALSIVSNLGSDRPENPLLLRQSDAFHLRDDEIDGRSVSVLVGPSPTSASTASTGAPDDRSGDDRVRYWIAEDGMLLRIQVKAAGATDWTVIDLGEADDVSLGAERLTRLLQRG